MTLPDFIIIGAMKCGTSTLATQLGLQDGIFITTPKEPNFFSDDPIHAQGIEWYSSLFDAAAPGDLKGEASTHYTKLPTHPDAAERMAIALKSPRLIYMIRDPIARLVSHYMHEWSMGMMHGSLADALDSHPELVDYSLYGRQLAPYVARFGRERILVIRLEDMQKAPQRTLEHVCRFLGHDGQPLWQAERSRENASAERIRRFPLHDLVFANPVATALRRRLVPQALRDRIKQGRQMHTRPDLPDDRRQALEARFAADLEALLDLFPDRTDLAQSYPFTNPVEASAECSLGKTAIIVIGRNEGARLLACLASLPRDVAGLIYVDSGSTDGSVAAARAAGARVVELDPARPFTAARARNEGVTALSAAGIAPDYLQFVDGDCTLDPDWLATATAFLDSTPKAAVVCGRRRERHPEASVYNRLCDREWNTPVGQALACGGDALMRRAAFVEMDGFRDDLIAGEEPELCVRLRAADWQVWRIDAEMAQHDAAMTRFSQWWTRTRRGGFAEANGAALHGAAPERRGVARTRRALFWGFMLPTATILASLIYPFFLTALVAYPVQIIRVALRHGGRYGDWEEAFFLTLGKLPEAMGALSYALHHYRKVAPIRIIEYK